MARNTIFIILYTYYVNRKKEMEKKNPNRLRIEPIGLVLKSDIKHLFGLFNNSKMVKSKIILFCHKTENY